MRVLFFTACASGAVCAATALAAATPIVSPTADPYYPEMQNTVGFGHVKPSEIFYGGDPTGLVCNIVWTSWGGSTARATGTGWYISGNESVAQGHFARANVVASRLGTWRGRRAYRTLTWSFPNRGRNRASSVGCP